MAKLSSFAEEFLLEVFQAHNKIITERNYDDFVFRALGESGESGEAFARAQYPQLLAFIKDSAQYEAAYSVLEDGRSKALFKQVLLFRILGHKHVKLPSNTPFYWEMRERAQNIAQTSSLPYTFGNLGSLQHFEFAWQGHEVKLDCFWGGPFYMFFIGQYHLKDPVRICVESGDHVIDAGACFGDSAIAFSYMTGEAGRVYSFDFVKDHVDITNYNIAQNALAQKNVTVLPYGLGDVDNKDAQLEQHDINPAQRIDLNLSDDEIPTRTLDSLYRDGVVERVDFIKMDIESFEPNALRGAVEVIRKFKPKLAISVYHTYDHMHEIPLLIKEILPEYKLYLDHHTIFHRETVLYAQV
ncbi:MAG: FkbM family methyltransferase [Micavibrio sp.]|nr:FkbM family methyltransferase [Micavibrio sp.]